MKNYECFILLWLLALVALGASIYYTQQYGLKPIAEERAAPTDDMPPAPTPLHMHVFIHGSFGTTLGLFNATDVLQDDIRGTRYHHVTKQMRTDPFFFKNQPILQRGLVHIEPTFCVPAPDEPKCAAYPIIKVYDELLTHFAPSSTPIRYYTFGWTGLLGQNHRRYESIRLYNALSEEIARLRALNFEPIIRLICHSHGGNLALNLHLINVARMIGLDQLVPGNIMHQAQREALKKMHALLVHHPSYTDTRDNPGQKQLDYLPDGPLLRINELLLFGCPLQPETDHCLAGDTFTTIAHFYSDEDAIQKLDWISTQGMTSKQRLEPHEIDRMYKTALRGREENSLKQIKIMVGRQTNRDGSIKHPDQTPPLWQRLLSDVGLLDKAGQDPGHKDLWFARWKRELAPNNLGPLPTVALTPLLLAVCDYDQPVDIDVNISIDEHAIRAASFAHGESAIECKHELPRRVIDQLLAHFMTWKPSLAGAKEEFKRINSYRLAAAHG